jgi:ParB family transcriptional regulator, chromosome partitioning protein
VEILRAVGTEVVERDSDGPTSDADLAVLSLSQLDDDAALNFRAESDISALATDVARLGQLFPIDVRPSIPGRFQIVCGFRRVAALRFLQRGQVLAWVHPQLSDDDALLLALASGIHGTQLSRSNLAAVKGRLEREGRLPPLVRDMLEKALAEDSSLAPEFPEEEVDADDLASQLTERVSDVNQDLALLADVFGSLDASRQEELLKQLRYAAELVAYLEDR